ncbi:uncharacterized protein LOC143886427 isoform X2 [Tasmannia lanceolata]
MGLNPSRRLVNSCIWRKPNAGTKRTSTFDSSSSHCRKRANQSLYMHKGKLLHLGAKRLKLLIFFTPFIVSFLGGSPTVGVKVVGEKKWNDVIWKGHFHLKSSPYLNHGISRKQSSKAIWKIARHCGCPRM